ncbi:hypothetical protein COCNU_01G016500 [Cocos nucifera]|uniref:Uncharacterized protein n=1 Tax=Cocos nucifera TaxID=13894 RepID=A0A8K0MV58_COCNU|nr:hypothetical protein COCNU_01G016500 [Cocos nucifera]
MESPEKKVEGDGRKTLRRFMKREIMHPSDQRLRVRIVAKPQPDGGDYIGTEDSEPQPDGGDHIGTEDSLKPEAELSDDTSNGEDNGAPCGTYISRRSRGVDYSTSGGDSVEEVIDVNSELLCQESLVFRKQPFSRIKALFCMDCLKVESEDDVYDFMLCWAQTHYPKPEDRCAAKELHLERLIRFTYLTRRKLEDALQCDFFYPESVTETVTEALAFKVTEPYRRRLAPGGCSSNRFLERRYKRAPVAVNRLWFPEFDRCEVYFSLTMSELLDMHHSLGSRESEDFQFGSQLPVLWLPTKRLEGHFILI